MSIDRKAFKDEKNRYIVQGLFLEDRYNKDMAVFTFDGEDKLYKGKTFISLKKRFIAEGDPEEYMFAEKWLFDWPHWQRMCKNAVIKRHIELWRDELYLSLRAEGIATLVDLAINKESYQAAKWLADEGWLKKAKGRPSKNDIDGELQRRASIAAEYEGDFELLTLHGKGKSNG